MLAVSQFLAVDLGLNIPPLALKRHPFGGAMLTSLASLGIEDGNAPLTRTLCLFK